MTSGPVQIVNRRMICVLVNAKEHHGSDIVRLRAIEKRLHSCGWNEDERGYSLSNEGNHKSSLMESIVTSNEGLKALLCTLNWYVSHLRLVNASDNR